MASPVPIAPVGGWNHNGQAMPPNNNEFEDSGVQLRPMGRMSPRSLPCVGLANILQSRYTTPLTRTAKSTV